MGHRARRPAVGGRWLLLACLLTAPPLLANDPPEAVSRPTLTADSHWSLRLPADARAIYRGLADFDGAGTDTAALLYPAPSVGGFLAAVITHGLLVESAKKSRKEEIQAAADRVLLPYRGVLDSYRFPDLMAEALGKTQHAGRAQLVAEGSAVVGDAVVESVPIISMTQDQQAIVLDHVLHMRSPVTAEAATYRNSIRVVSRPRDEPDPVAYWTADGGRKLKEEIAGLLALSLDIAFADAIGGKGAGAPQRTVRYREGSRVRMQRAEVLDEQCGRVLMRNLRGDLMSVPAARPTLVASTGNVCPP